MPGYVDPSELARWLRIDDENEDVSLTIVIEQASQQIDAHCGRSFSDDVGSGNESARIYAARWSDIVYVDDIATTDGFGLAVDTSGNGTYDQTWTSSDYQLEPLNQIRAGLVDHPYYRIRAVGSKAFPVDPEARVEVTARWGWTTVPAAIRQATLLHAGRLHSRRNNASAIAESSPFPTRLAMGLDRDVVAVLDPFVRADLLVRS